MQGWEQHFKTSDFIEAMEQLVEDNHHPLESQDHEIVEVYEGDSSKTLRTSSFKLTADRHAPATTLSCTRRVGGDGLSTLMGTNFTLSLTHKTALHY